VMLDTVGTLYRTFGLRGLRRRGLHELRRRFDRYAAAPRLPLHSVVAIPGRWPFVADLAAIAATTNRSVALERADRVCAGEYQAYGHQWLPLPSSPPVWNVQPGSGHLHDPSQPWWRIPLLGEFGDVKDVWEPARFGWVYDLVRGYAITGDSRYAEAFWRGVESFAGSAVPMRGVQWACGQETAIRAVALLWGEASFANDTTATRERLLTVQRLLVASGERIHDAIDYALSQRNNHAISEATGLIAIGARFAGSWGAAGDWYRSGRTLLRESVLDQVAEDGWYIQHSFTYARLASDMIVIARRCQLHAGDDLGVEERRRATAMARMLATVTDERSGDVPNHGPNDGALVLPLGTAGYRDFRPAVTALHATLGVPWPERLRQCNEALAWLGAELAPADGSPEESAVTHGSSGWAFVRCGDVRVFARAGSYDSRPGHIDPLHVDVWVRGAPVAIDAGTYRYNAPPPWRNALAAERVHNTVTLPDHPIARKGPRFLWLSAPAATVDSASPLPDGSGAVVRMTNHSWSSTGVTHVRVVSVADSGVTVDDELTATGAGAVAVELHWLIDTATRVRPEVTCSGEMTVHQSCGDESSVRGWRSLHYGSREPALSSTCRGTIRGEALRFRTFFDLSRDSAGE
jgi:hypothetical protein